MSRQATIIPLDQLPLSQLADELDAAEAKLATAKKAVARIEAEVLRRYTEQVRVELAKKDEPFGTAHVIADGFDIKFTVGKKVEWDQEKLRALRDQIAKDGAEPDEFIDLTVSYNIPEARYSAWGANLKQAFNDARTVAPKKAAVELKRVDE